MATKKAPTKAHHSKLDKFLKTLAGLAAVAPTILAPFEDAEDRTKTNAAATAASAILGALGK